MSHKELDKPQIFTIKNSRKQAFWVAFEPTGMGMEVHPGEEYEVVMDVAGFFQYQPNIEITDSHMIFWNVLPEDILYLGPDGKESIM